MSDINRKINSNHNPIINDKDKNRIDILSKNEKQEKNEKAWEKDSGFIWEVLKSIDNLSLSDNNKELNMELISEFDNFESNQLISDINERISYQPIFFRGLIVIIDFDENISKRNTIFYPNKLDYLKDRLLELGKLYFERNFLSSISIIGVSDYTAKVLITSCSDFKTFSKELMESWPKTGYGSGSFSFYNSLYVSLNLISTVVKL